MDFKPNNDKGSLMKYICICSNPQRFYPLIASASMDSEECYPSTDKIKNASLLHTTGLPTNTKLSWVLLIHQAVYNKARSIKLFRLVFEVKMIVLYFLFQNKKKTFWVTVKKIVDPILNVSGNTRYMRSNYTLGFTVSWDNNCNHGPPCII